VISPASFALTTGLLLQGASGETRSEIERALNVKHLENLANQVNSDKSVSSANKVYISKNFTLRQTYLQNVKKLYDSEAEKVDFTLKNQTAQKINKWIEEKTRGLIKTMINPEIFDNKTAALLINAMYFKGEWNQSFKILPDKRDFRISATKKINIEFMRLEQEFFFGYFPDLDCKTVEIPYKNSSLSMVFVLPFEDDGLKLLEQNLTPLKLRKLLTPKKGSSKKMVDVILPRFKIESDKKLNDVAEKVS
jgi:serpin B